jgi:hypothetical protein
MDNFYKINVESVDAQTGKVKDLATGSENALPGSSDAACYGLISISISDAAKSQAGSSGVSMTFYCKD